MIWFNDGVGLPCRLMIKKFKESDAMVEPSLALTSNYREGRSLRISGRREWFNINRVVHMAVGTAFKRYNDLNDSFASGIVEDTGYTIHEYLPGQVARYHRDGGQYQLDIFLAMVFFLNTVPSGSLEFDRQSFGIAPVRNRVVVFPAHFAYPHYSKPSSEKRYVLVTWLKYKNWRTTTGVVE